MAGSRGGNDQTDNQEGERKGIDLQELNENAMDSSQFKVNTTISIDKAELEYSECCRNF